MATASTWPRDIPGITRSGTHPPFGDGFTAHLQTVTISTDLGRTELFELGIRKLNLMFFLELILCSLLSATAMRSAVLEINPSRELIVALDLIHC